MSIRPVDLSGMIQRTQDVGNIKQTEDNKPVVQQYNIEARQLKQEERLSHKVQKSERKENEGFRYDAKEKGSNSYSREEQKKKRQAKEPENGGKVVPKGGTGGFDVKI